MGGPSTGGKGYGYTGNWQYSYSARSRPSSSSNRQSDVQPESQARRSATPVRSTKESKKKERVAMVESRVVELQQQVRGQSVQSTSPESAERLAQYRLLEAELKSAKDILSRCADDTLRPYLKQKSTI